MIYLLIFVIIMAITETTYAVGYVGSTFIIFWNRSIRATETKLLLRCGIGAALLTTSLMLTVFAVALGQVVFK